MSGYHTIIRLRRIEEQIAHLGFMFCYPKHGGGTGDVEMVALRPATAESVPIYSRDAEVFCGTLEQLEVWLRGVAWARDYDRMLRVSDDKKRARKEQDVRNQQLMQRLKSEQVAQKD